MSDVCLLPATDQAALLREKKLSSVELLDLQMDRVRQFNPDLNAIVTLDAESARAAASTIDENRAGDIEKRALTGLSVSIKDAFEVAGMVSTGGMPELKDHVPDRDAVPVDRLRNEGVVIFGKTNLPYASGDFQSFNDVYGTTNNPHDLVRTPGGSSGGAAVAVATGMSAFEIGSDIGGSIRLPAHFTGIFGHKPTFEIVPKRGHIPPLPGFRASADLSVAGPLARSASDLKAVLDVVAGAIEHESAWALELPKSRAESAKDLRVAVWTDEPFTDVDNEYKGMIENAARELERGGAKMDFDARPDFSFEEAYVNYALIVNAIMASDFPQSIRDRLLAEAENIDPKDTGHAAMQARGAALSYAETMRQMQKRAFLQAKWSAFFEDFDVVLCPVTPGFAIKHDHQRVAQRTIKVNGTTRPYMDLIHWASLATGSHLPASVAPIGRTKSGLPAGVQIIGPKFGDYTTITVAGILEALMGGFQPPSDYS